MALGHSFANGDTNGAGTAHGVRPRGDHPYGPASSEDDDQHGRSRTGSSSNLARGMAAAALLLCLAVLNPLLVRASQDGRGKYAYQTQSVVLMQEVIKVSASVAALALEWRAAKTAAAAAVAADAGAGSTVEGGNDLAEEAKRASASIIVLNRRTFALFGVPGVLYVAGNNLHYQILRYLSPTSFKVLEQVKIIITAGFMRMLLGTRLRRRQWLAVGLVFVGCVVSELRPAAPAAAVGDDEGAGAEGETRSEGHYLGLGVALSQPPLGYVLLLVQATCNNFAAVFTERMLKSTPGSLNWQNLQMYSYGVVISVLSLAARGVPFAEWLTHYNGYTWGLVFLGGFTGLCTSAVMKWADNLVKVFARAGSMFLLAAVSGLMGNPVPTQLLLGGVITAVGVALYSIKPETALAACARLGCVPGAAPGGTSGGETSRRLNGGGVSERGRRLIGGDVGGYSSSASEGASRRGVGSFSSSADLLQDLRNAARDSS